MEIKRILGNGISILMSRSDEGKTMFLCNLIESYKKRFDGDVWVFGLKDELVEKLKVRKFSGLLELEQIRNSIVIIDEVGKLFDLENRTKRKLIDGSLRLINHNGNKILLSGIPTDFKKFLCAKAKCFMFKSLNIFDMINGSMAKQVLLQNMDDSRIGTLSLEIEKNKVLCYDGHYWDEEFKYNRDYDTKKGNLDLFAEKSNKKGKEKC